MLQGESLWHDTALLEGSDVGGEAEGKQSSELWSPEKKITLEKESHSISHCRERFADLLFPPPNEALASSAALREVEVTSKPLGQQGEESGPCNGHYG